MAYQFMKLLKWIRFTWDLTKLPVSDVALPQHYAIAPAGAEDEQGLRKVFSSSFLLDPSWSFAIGEVMQTIQSRLDVALASDKFICLALRHGTRIIGAAVLALDENTEDQLAPGPSILMEYRNRGLGTCLLQSSLPPHCFLPRSPPPPPPRRSRHRRSPASFMSTGCSR